MNEQFSRRDFLKLAGLGAATTAILTGCGPASRYVKREPYQQMPEYNSVGQSTYYATTCRECAAGCGLVVRTYQGRALKTEGNANHPLNLGKTCARGQATLQGLYNPDRVQAPSTGDWDTAIQAVADALKNYKPNEIAFLMGMAPDHLFDLVTDLAKATGMNAPVRFGALSMFEARATLSKAAENLFGQAGLPFFDVGGAQTVFSFGANFLETWLSPVSYTRGFAGLREAETKLRGKFVQFEPRMSATGAKSDHWVPLRPGTEGLVALAIGKLAAEIRGGSTPRAFSGVNPAEVAETAGVELAALEHLAEMFANSNALAIPGGAALGQSNGLEIAEAVLALNALSDNFGKPGGVYLSAFAPMQTEYNRPASAEEMGAFIEKMKSGAFKAVFIHGVNPVFELPASLGFKEALGSVEQVVSFATFPDETSAEAKYVFPDHHGLESWGYQRVATGVALPVLSGAQPVVSPFYDTRATADVLIAAAQLAGGKFAEALPYKDEVEFLQTKVGALLSEANGSFTAPDTATFMAYFQQYGGWLKNTDALVAPDGSGVLNSNLKATDAEFAGEGEFFFVPFVSPTLAEAGANKPWLQELPDPTTTVMWNTWIEMNPETAHELGIVNDDVVKVISEAGEVQAFVYLYPAIRPDTIAMPFGQGHTAFGRYAEKRGVNPADLLAGHFNGAGDLAFAGMKVKVEKVSSAVSGVGLSRMESRIGVYGEALGEEH
ncbi:MAG: molybdopterin-dependent oxidoreductase [Anaerolineales bacterium]|uniref:molybdopterin dinucleotide binding domain-containing protein n=1 Tax=Candidatus Villigracilis vicinus TaxID=3140679 RepID=UPI0031358649|nr:molybdopterin-dependent oxidoreductase [Anaerolineales bacterium]MBK9779426.1 molybdopterin-dependent oxidoreductase [Anaerolineales bacterium]